MTYLQRGTPKALGGQRRSKSPLHERKIEIHVLGVTARFGVERLTSGRSADVPRAALKRIVYNLGSRDA